MEITFTIDDAFMSQNFDYLSKAEADYVINMMVGEPAEKIEKYIQRKVKAYVSEFLIEKRRQEQ